MAGNGCKKYMKKNAQKEDYTLLKLFVIVFFGMLLVFTFLIKSFTPSVDVSIGGDRQEVEADNSEDMKKIVDDRLAMIQDEDQGRNFSDLMKNAEDKNASNQPTDNDNTSVSNEKVDSIADAIVNQVADPVYKVFIGTYTSAEQAKVAKDIILETGTGLTPIVKCIGSNNYTLQVGIFKNKQSAEALLYTVQQNHLPGRIVQEY